MRNRNNGRNSNLGFENRKRKQSSNKKQINHKLGFIEDFGDGGMVASESVRNYATVAKIEKPEVKKVNILIKHNKKSLLLILKYIQSVLLIRDYHQDQVSDLSRILEMMDSSPLSLSQFLMYKR